jgi:hypothetical protein
MSKTLFLSDGQVPWIDPETGRDYRFSASDLRLDVKRLLHKLPESTFRDNAPLGTKVMVEDNRVHPFFLSHSYSHIRVKLGYHAQGIQ